jgi:hypothetical protein
MVELLVLRENIGEMIFFIRTHTVWGGRGGEGGSKGHKYNSGYMCPAVGEGWNLTKCIQ